MLTFWPTSALSNVDLPTLGRPTMATRPQRRLSLGGAEPSGTWFSVMESRTQRAAWLGVAGLQGHEHAARGFLFRHAARTALARFGEAQCRNSAFHFEGLG